MERKKQILCIRGLFNFKIGYNKTFFTNFISNIGKKMKLLALHCIHSINFMHLADAFIQSDLQCIQAIHVFVSTCSLGIEPTTFCAANAMLYH